MYRSSPFHSTLNTGYITALDMCEVCTEAVHSVALWTRVTLQLWTCVKYVRKQSIPKHFEHGLHYSFGHVWSMYRAVHSVALWTRVTLQLWTCVKYVPKQSIPQHFEHGLHYSFGHVWSMYQSSPFRRTLNTGYITALDMCEVCTEAVHSVALWTRVTLQLWTCVRYVPKQSIP